MSHNVGNWVDGGTGHSGGSYRDGSLYEYSDSDTKISAMEPWAKEDALWLMDKGYSQRDISSWHVFDPYYLYPKPFPSEYNEFYGTDSHLRVNQRRPLLNPEAIDIKMQVALKRRLQSGFLTRPPAHQYIQGLPDLYDDLDWTMSYQHPIHPSYTWRGIWHNFWNTILYYPAYQFRSTFFPRTLPSIWGNRQQIPLFTLSFHTYIKQPIYEILHWLLESFLDATASPVSRAMVEWYRDTSWHLRRHIIRPMIPTIRKCLAPVTIITKGALFLTGKISLLILKLLAQPFKITLHILNWLQSPSDGMTVGDYNDLIHEMGRFISPAKFERMKYSLAGRQQKNREQLQYSKMDPQQQRILYQQKKYEHQLKKEQRNRRQRSPQSKSKPESATRSQPPPRRRRYRTRFPTLFLIQSRLYRIIQLISQFATQFLTPNAIIGLIQQIPLSLLKLYDHISFKILSSILNITTFNYWPFTPGPQWMPQWLRNFDLGHSIRNALGLNFWPFTLLEHRFVVINGRVISTKPRIDSFLDRISFFFRQIGLALRTRWVYTMNRFVVSPLRDYVIRPIAYYSFHGAQFILTSVLRPIVFYFLRILNILLHPQHVPIVKIFVQLLHVFISWLWQLGTDFIFTPITWALRTTISLLTHTLSTSTKIVSSWEPMFLSTSYRSAITLETVWRKCLWDSWTIFNDKVILASYDILYDGLQGLGFYDPNFPFQLSSFDRRHPAPMYAHYNNNRRIYFRNMERYHEQSEITMIHREYIRSENVDNMLGYIIKRNQYFKALDNLHDVNEQIKPIRFADVIIPGQHSKFRDQLLGGEDGKKDDNPIVLFNRFLKQSPLPSQFGNNSDHDDDKIHANISSLLDTKTSLFTRHDDDHTDPTRKILDDITQLTNMATFSGNLINDYSSGLAKLSSAVHQQLNNPAVRQHPNPPVGQHPNPTSVLMTDGDEYRNHHVYGSDNDTDSDTYTDIDDDIDYDDHYEYNYYNRPNTISSDFDNGDDDPSFPDQGDIDETDSDTDTKSSPNFTRLARFSIFSHEDPRTKLFPNPSDLFSTSFQPFHSLLPQPFLDKSTLSPIASRDFTDDTDEDDDGLDYDPFRSNNNHSHYIHDNDGFIASNHDSGTTTRHDSNSQDPNPRNNHTPDFDLYDDDNNYNPHTTPTYYRLYNAHFDNAGELTEDERNAVLFPKKYKDDKLPKMYRDHFEIKHELSTRYSKSMAYNDRLRHTGGSDSDSDSYQHFDTDGDDSDIGIPGTIDYGYDYDPNSHQATRRYDKYLQVTQYEIDNDITQHIQSALTPPPKPIWTPIRPIPERPEPPIWPWDNFQHYKQVTLDRTQQQYTAVGKPPPISIQNFLSAEPSLFRLKPPRRIVIPIPRSLRTFFRFLQPLGSAHFRLLLFAGVLFYLYVPPVLSQFRQLQRYYSRGCLNDIFLQDDKSDLPPPLPTPGIVSKTMTRTNRLLRQFVALWFWAIQTEIAWANWFLTLPVWGWCYHFLFDSWAEWRQDQIYTATCMASTIGLNTLGDWVYNLPNQPRLRPLFDRYYSYKPIILNHIQHYWAISRHYCRNFLFNVLDGDGAWGDLFNDPLPGSKLDDTDDVVGAEDDIFAADSANPSPLPHFDIPTQDATLIQETDPEQPPIPDATPAQAPVPDTAPAQAPVPDTAPAQAPVPDAVPASAQEAAAAASPPPITMVETTQTPEPSANFTNNSPTDPTTSPITFKPVTFSLFSLPKMTLRYSISLMVQTFSWVSNLSIVKFATSPFEPIIVKISPYWHTLVVDRFFRFLAPLNIYSVDTTAIDDDIVNSHPPILIPHPPSQRPSRLAGTLRF